MTWWGATSPSFPPGHRLPCRGGPLRGRKHSPQPACGNDTRGWIRPPMVGSPPGSNRAGSDLKDYEDSSQPPQDWVEATKSTSAVVSLSGSSRFTM